MAGLLALCEIKPFPTGKECQLFCQGLISCICYIYHLRSDQFIRWNFSWFLHITRGPSCLSCYARQELKKYCQRLFFSPQNSSPTSPPSYGFIKRAGCISTRVFGCQPASPHREDQNYPPAGFRASAGCDRGPRRVRYLDVPKRLGRVNQLRAPRSRHRLPGGRGG